MCRRITFPGYVNVGLLLFCFCFVDSLEDRQSWAIAAEPYLIVLGIAQDGGFPQAGCEKDCCRAVWNSAALRRYVSCLALVDPDSGQRWLFDCTPDFRDQLKLLDDLAPQGTAVSDRKVRLDGIFPTHAHIGHYAGLLQLGREVMGARSVPVYCMPRMRYFLESNGPWSQLVELQQIDMVRMVAGDRVAMNARLSVVPFLVPHRDEFSETVGFQIVGPQRTAIYLPDIDKWERWDVRVESLIGEADIAFLDGTFLDADELPGRDMSEIPHPLVAESIQRFQSLPERERAKIQFIHLNHSNPLLRADSEARQALEMTGMKVAEQAALFEL